MKTTQAFVITPVTPVPVNLQASTLPDLRAALESCMADKAKGVTIRNLFGAHLLTVVLDGRSFTWRACGADGNAHAGGSYRFADVKNNTNNVFDKILNLWGGAPINVSLLP